MDVPLFGLALVFGLPFILGMAFGWWLRRLDAPERAAGHASHGPAAQLLGGPG